LCQQNILERLVRLYNKVGAITIVLEN